MNRLQVLERMKNKALRFIFWYDYHQEGLSTLQLYKKYGMLRLTDLVKYESVMTIFRVRHGVLKTTVNFPLNSESNVRSARRQSCFCVRRSRTGYHLNSLAHRGINCFNELPGELRREHNLLPFKRSLKEYLCSAY